MLEVLTVLLPSRLPVGTPRLYQSHCSGRALTEAMSS